MWLVVRSCALYFCPPPRVFFDVPPIREDPRNVENDIIILTKGVLGSEAKRLTSRIRACLERAVINKPPLAFALPDSSHRVWHEVLPTLNMQGIPGVPRSRISHFLVVAEEQDSSPPASSVNQEETADSHTNAPPPIEGDTGGGRSQHLDTHSSEEQSTHPVIEEQTSIPDPIGVVMHGELKGNDTDLLSRIRGLYRLLDLINEQGSGGAGMINIP